MKEILYVLDVGLTPMGEIEGLAYFAETLLSERKVAGVWYRERKDWQKTIKEARGEVFDTTRTETLGDDEICIMTLLVPA